MKTWKEASKFYEHKLKNSEKKKVPNMFKEREALLLKDYPFEAVCEKRNICLFNCP